jgi:hypothetical protein
VSSLYVFALAGQAVAPFVAAGHCVETVRIGDVYAAVERLSQPPGVSEEALRTQHDVVARVARRVDAVLPARFGAFVDARELSRVVSERRETILEALTLVRGRQQMTVRLLGPERPDAAEIARATDTRPTTGTDYLESRREVLSGRQMPAAFNEVAVAVRGIVAAERTEAGRGRVIATLYHLVDTEKIDTYRDAVALVHDGIGGASLTVSGPWPPFAFTPDLWA